MFKKFATIAVASIAAVALLSGCTEVPQSLQRYKAHHLVYKVSHSKTYRLVKITYGFQTVTGKRWDSSARLQGKYQWTKNVYTIKKNTIEYVEINAKSSVDNDLLTCKVYLDGHLIVKKIRRGSVTC